MTDERIFDVLCLICKIMIYRLPKRDSIDSMRIKRFKDELDIIKGDVE